MHRAYAAVWLMLAAEVAAQGAISVNFQGSGGRPVLGVAGAQRVGRWNNLTGGGSLAPLALVHDDGVDRGVRVTFTSASVGGRQQPPGVSDDAALFDGQILASAQGGAAVVELSGVPFRRYDVLVYVGHGPAEVGRQVRLSVGARTVLFANENVAAYGDPVQFRAVTASAPPVVAGNMATVRGCRGARLTLTLEPAPGSLLAGTSGIAGLQILDVAKDSDGDGLEDGWEQQWFGNLTATATADPDRDGLVNLDEQARECDPRSADTDRDLLDDGAEVRLGTDPTNPDSDGDGLRDGVETRTGRYVSSTDTGTDPLRQDSDGDHGVDGAEVRRGSNPNAIGSRAAMPNVVVILVDDLGVGDLGVYGNRLLRTPNLDRMASEGVRFTQFYAGGPVCAPSRCTLLTGQHTGHAQTRTNVAPPLRVGTRTLAHLLSEQGYVTACVGKWGFGDVMTTGHPRRVGFEQFFGFLDQEHAHWHYPAYLWRNEQQVLYPRNNGLWGPQNRGQDHAHDELTREALAFVDQHRARPFFLLLTWTMPHVSLQEPPHSDPERRAAGETAIDEFYDDVTWPEPNANFASSHYTSHARPRRAYAAMISALDRDVGRLRARLEQHGIARDTLILFLSDNGATDCCGVDRTFFASHAGLRGSKGDVYEGGIRVPAIAYWPGKIAPGRVSDHVAAMWDVLPTLAEVTESAVPADCDGVSFLPTLLANPSCQGQHEALYWEYEQGELRKAARVGSWKAVRRGIAGRAALELYDLANDPSEVTDVAARWPAVVAQMERVMAAGHAPAGHATFHRGDDEFPLRRDVVLAFAPPGFVLVAQSGRVGSVVAPFAHDVEHPVEITFSLQVADVAPRANAALTLGDGPDPATHVHFGLDARRRELFIARGSVRHVVPLVGSDTPWRTFWLRARFEPRTGMATLSEGTRQLVAGSVGSLPRLGYYGHVVDDAVAVFGAIDPPASALRAPGRYTVFGQGCVGSAGRPVLALLHTPPALGRCTSALVSSLPTSGGGPVIGLVGSSTTAFGGVPLPLPLDTLGMTGCQLLVSAEQLVPLSNVGGRAVWSTPLPSTAALLGMRFHQQALVMDPTANAAGMTTSNGASATVGAAR